MDRRKQQAKRRPGNAAVVRKKSRKKKSKGNALRLLVIFAMVLFVLYEFVFVIRNVEVNGTSTITPEEIVRTADLDFGKSIFGGGDEKIRQRINALGEIELVRISRRLPSTIVLDVNTRIPAAMAVFQNKIVVMDKNGYVIRITDSLPGTGVLFKGLHIMSCRVGSQLSAGQDQTDTMCEILAAIEANGAAQRIAEVNLEDTDDIVIKTVNGVTVRVGNIREIDRKLAWMMGALRDLESRGQKGGTLDVSSGNKADYVAPVVTEDK